jgi:hypothetical protein
LASHSNVLGLRRVPLGQRPNLDLGLGDSGDLGDLGLGDLGDLGDLGFASGGLGDLGLGIGSGFALGFIFCLGTHSFVILFRTIPLGHLFDLTGLTLFLFLPESIFDFVFVFDFTGDDRDILAGDAGSVSGASVISQKSNGKHPVLMANWSGLKGFANTVYSFPFLLISSKIIFRGNIYSLSFLNTAFDTILIKGNPSSRYII